MKSKARLRLNRAAVMETLPTIDPLPYLTAGQTAKALGIHRQTLHDRIERGELVPSGVTPDGLYVFSRAYVEGLVSERGESVNGDRSAGEGRAEAGDGA